MFWSQENIYIYIYIVDTMFAIGCLDGCMFVYSSETYQPILQFLSPEKYKGDKLNYPYSIQDMVCVDEVKYY